MMPATLHTYARTHPQFVPRPCCVERCTTGRAAGPRAARAQSRHASNPGSLTPPAPAESVARICNAFHDMRSGRKVRSEAMPVGALLRPASEAASGRVRPRRAWPRRRQKPPLAGKQTHAVTGKGRRSAEDMLPLAGRGPAHTSWPRAGVPRAAPSGVATPSPRPQARVQARKTVIRGLPESPGAPSGPCWAGRASAVSGAYRRRQRGLTWAARGRCSERPALANARARSALADRAARAGRPLNSARREHAADSRAASRA